MVLNVVSLVFVVITLRAIYFVYPIQIAAQQGVQHVAQEVIAQKQVFATETNLMETIAKIIQNVKVAFATQSVVSVNNMMIL